MRMPFIILAFDSYVFYLCLFSKGKCYAYRKVHVHYISSAIWGPFLNSPETFRLDLGCHKSLYILRRKTFFKSSNFEIILFCDDLKTDILRAF